MKIRHDYITYLRGVAALIVTGGHVIGMVPNNREFNNFFEAPLLTKILWPFLFGAEMIWLFILLSGYSLWMNYSSKSNSPSLKTYTRRRLIRIIPTYYFALGVAYFLLRIPSVFQTPPNSSLDTYGPITKEGIISHILLVHILSHEWMFQINPPLWSIGVEIQLYFLLGVFFFGKARRHPKWTALVLILTTKCLSFLTGFHLFWLSHWFLVGVILFELSKTKMHAVYLNKYVLLMTGCVSMTRILHEYPLVYEVTWMLFLLNLITYCSKKTSSRNSILSKIGMSLGNSSYSLYVIHFPFALLTWWLISYLRIEIIDQTFTMIILSTPLIALATYVCYKLVEEKSIKLMDQRP
jgi:peptidoglycan/LPS O-acetylase OafA/YrhL